MRQAPTSPTLRFRSGHQPGRITCPGLPLLLQQALECHPLRHDRPGRQLHTQTQVTGQSGKNEAQTQLYVT